MLYSLFAMSADFPHPAEELTSSDVLTTLFLRVDYLTRTHGANDGFRFANIAVLIQQLSVYNLALNGWAPSDLPEAPLAERLVAFRGKHLRRLPGTFASVDELRTLWCKKYGDGDLVPRTKHDFLSLLLTAPTGQLDCVMRVCHKRPGLYIAGYCIINDGVPGCRA